jgi:hypothetical protein
VPAAVRLDAMMPVEEQADAALAAFERAGGRVPWKESANREVRM